MDEPIPEVAKVFSGRTAMIGRVVIVLAVAAAAFLIGFIPERIRASRAVNQLDKAQDATRLLQIQTSLATAAIDARRGEYERARRMASQFFTELLAERDRGKESALSIQQRQQTGALLGPRDDIITLLSRADPASADRLADLYVKYQAEMGEHATGNAPLVSSP